MNKNIAKSFNSNAFKAAQEIKEQFSEINNINCVVFFASYLYNSDDLASAMQQQFPDIECFGTSSGVEMTLDDITTGSLVAVAFTSDIMEDFCLDVIENLMYDNVNIDSCVQKFSSHYNNQLFNLSPKEYFGLIFIDFNSKAEEKLFNELGSISQIVFLGATASDYWKFDSTCVYANGRVYKNAAVIVLFKPKVKFNFEKFESVEEIAPPMVVTKSDYDTKILYELDGRPAAEVYCEVMGLNYNQMVGKIGGGITPNIRTHPLGINIDGQLYLRDIFRINEDNTLTMVCNIPESLMVHFYKVSDIIKDTGNYCNYLHQKYHNVGLMLSFACLNRYEDIKSTKDIEKYLNIFNGIPIAGFGAYGEYYTVPVNHTTTSLVLFKE